MNEQALDALYSLIGRLYVELRVANVRIQQLQEQLKPATPPPDESK